MKFLAIKLLSISLFCAGILLLPGNVSANAPRIFGQIYTETGAEYHPATEKDQFWIRWTNKEGTYRYAQINRNGQYEFISQQSHRDVFEQEQKKDIDFNNDGAVDAKMAAAKGDFGCKGSPHKFSIMRPSHWAGAGDIVTIVRYKVYHPEDENSFADSGAVTVNLIEFNFSNDTPDKRIDMFIKNVKQTSIKELRSDISKEQVGITQQNLGFTCLETYFCSDSSGAAAPPDATPTPEGTANRVRSCGIDTKPSSGRLRRVQLVGVNELYRKLTISANRQNNPPPGYVMECVQIGTSYVCTSGNKNVDAQAFGAAAANANWAKLPAGYKASFVEAGEADLSKTISQPIKNTSDVKDAVQEWVTQVSGETLNSVFVMVFDTTNIDAVRAGNTGGLQQATLSFDAGCQLVQDPYGRVFDAHTLEPLSAVSLSLLRKTGGQFTLLKNGDISAVANVNTLTNPQSTKVDGSFSFNVPDGTYKLEPKLAGYTFPNKTSNLNPKTSQFYTDLYRGEEIVQKGQMVHKDIPLDPTDLKKSEEYAATNPVKIAIHTQTVDKQKDEYNVDGRVSHPKATMILYSEVMNKKGQMIRNRILTRGEADTFGRFHLSFKVSQLKANESLGQLDAVKKKFNAKSATQKDTVYLEPVLNKLNGIAYDGEGKIIPGAKVEIIVPFSDKSVASTVADKDGRFHIDSKALPPIAYDIRFTSLSGAKDVVSPGTFLAKNMKSVQTNNLTIAYAGDPNGAVLGASDNGKTPPSYIHRVITAIMVILIIGLGLTFSKRNHS